MMGAGASSTRTGPPQRFRHTITRVPGRPDFVVVGGQLSSSDVKDPPGKLYVGSLDEAGNFKQWRLQSLSCTSGRQQLPHRYEHSACAVGRQVLVYGGNEAESGHLSSKVFAIDTDTWTWRCIFGSEGSTSGVVGRDFPKARRNHIGAVLDSHSMAVFSGHSAMSVAEDSWIFDVRNNGWCKEGRELDDMWLLKADTRVWERVRLKDGPKARTLPAMVSMNERVYLVGGSSAASGGHGLEIFRDVWEVDPRGDRWKIQNLNGVSLPEGVYRHAMAAFDELNVMVSFGGTTRQIERSNRVVALKLRADRTHSPGHRTTIDVGADNSGVLERPHRTSSPGTLGGGSSHQRTPPGTLPPVSTHGTHGTHSGTSSSRYTGTLAGTTGSSAYGWNSSLGSSPWGSSYHREDPKPPGQRGLSNIGNTCFMNAALQCLSNTVFLRDFFLTDVYRRELNVENPIGCKGEMATTFGDLIHALWDEGGKSPFRPTELKAVVGGKAPQFQGLLQQDSHELLTFVLDGLHEDLNRIRRKPAVPALENTSRMTDGEIADESWARHRARNDSVVMDLFGGQLECPSCKRVTVVFDAFTNLSLPIRTDADRAKKMFPVHYLPPDYPASPATLVQVNMRDNVRIGDVRAKVAERMGANPKDLLMSTSWSLKHTHREDSWSLTHFQPTDSLYASHLPGLADMDPERCVVFMAKCYQLTGGKKPGVVFAVPTTATKKDLCDAVGARFGQFFSPRTDFRGTCVHLHFPGRVLTRLSLGRSGVLQPVDVNPRSMERPLRELPSVVEAPSERLPDTGTGPPVDNTPSLARCFRLFCSREQLDERNTWYCSRCKDHVRAFKETRLWKVPPVLVLQLKRFEYTLDQWGGRCWESSRKIEMSLDVPLGVELNIFDFDLRPFLCPEAQGNEQMLYRLFACTNHHGTTYGGHYTAFGAVDPPGGAGEATWHNFDDSFVEKIGPQPQAMEVNRGAYVLFMRRIGIDPRDVIGHGPPVWQPGPEEAGSSGDGTAPGPAPRVSPPPGSAPRVSPSPGSASRVSPSPGSSFPGALRSSQQLPPALSPAGAPSSRASSFTASRRSSSPSRSRSPSRTSHGRR